MKQIVKWVKIRGQYGVHKHKALIDTGSQDTIVPRWIATQAGTWHGGKTIGDVAILGERFDVEIHKAEIEIEGTGCKATTRILVPTEETVYGPEFIIGSLFLQETNAAIIYAGDHPILNFPGKQHFFSRGGGVRLMRKKSGPELQPSTSPRKRKVKKVARKRAKKVVKKR